jgi:hypothetical protein
MKTATAPSLPGRQETTTEWIFMRDIYVDPSYQRPLEEARVEAMARDFDPDAVGLPFVVEIRQKNGKVKYAIIDGQHRIGSARKCFGDDQMIKCEIIRNISVARAAALFEKRNKMKKPRLIDRFIALETAKDEETMEILAIVRGLGLNVHRTRGDNIVQAVGALQKVYRGERMRGTGKNPNALRRTLEICQEAWGPSPDAFNENIVLGIGMVLNRHADAINTDELLRKLKSYPGGALRLLGNARGLRAIDGGSIAHTVAAIVVKTYSKGKRGKGLPPWRESDKDA